MTTDARHGQHQDTSAGSDGTTTAAEPDLPSVSTDLIRLPDGPVHVPLGRRPVACGTYIASRASLPERSAAWRRLRDIDGWKITCSWIDEAGAGQTPDLGQLWTRIEAEIVRSERLILYVEPGDFPLKGALIEVGMAIACRVPIRVVAPGVVLDPVSFRPIGSWVRHPLVAFCDTMDEALEGTTFSL